MCLQSSNEGELVQEWTACAPSTSKPFGVCRVNVQKTQTLCEIPIQVMHLDELWSSPICY